MSVDGTLAPGRTCGGCTVCCEVLNIDEPELRKPAGVMCRHADDQGCTLYSGRPHSCRAFFCAWRQLDVMPESARPDRLDVIFWVTGRPNPEILFETVYVIGAAVKDPHAMDKDEVRDLVETFIRDGDLPVFLQWGGHQHLIHPGPELADAILNPVTTPHRHLIEQGKAWLRRYAPHARAAAGPAARLPAGY